MKKLFIVFAAGVMLVIAFLGGAIVAQTKSSPYTHIVKAERAVFGRDLAPVAGYQLKQSIYETRAFDRVVFFGDSHAELGNWTQLLKRDDIANRGISGDTTRGLLNRMDRLPENSQVVVIIGTNDVETSVPSATIDNIEEIVTKLSATNKVVLVSTPLTADARWNQFNAAVAAAEPEICQRLGCTFADINQVIAADGRLKPEMTVDGSHLNDAGYQAVASVLAPLLTP